MNSWYVLIGALMLGVITIPIYDCCKKMETEDKFYAQSGKRLVSLFLARTFISLIVFFFINGILMLYNI